MTKSLVKVDPETALAKAAAAEAVKDVVIDLVKRGIADNKVKAIAAATEEILVGGKGFEGRAKEELAQAFSNEDADALFREISQAAA